MGAAGVSLSRTDTQWKKCSPVELTTSIFAHCLTGDSPDGTLPCLPEKSLGSEKADLPVLPEGEAASPRKGPAPKSPVDDLACVAFPKLAKF